MRFVVGIDEAGRGPLAGPIYFGGCRASFRKEAELLEFFRDFPFGKDSKKLTEAERVKWFKRLLEAKRQNLIAVSVLSASPEDIDSQGLSKVSKNLVERLLHALHAPAQSTRVLLDGGLVAPTSFREQETIIKGDEKVFLISLASIAAKVSRDKRMMALARHFRGYGFEQHKGYPTKAHFEALNRLGISPLHRRRFLVKWRMRNGDIY